MTNPTEPMTDLPFTQSEESFLSDGTRCAALVFRPTGEAGRRVPMIVMAHGFGAVRMLRLDAYAERFAAAGYGVITFDYRHFGDSDGQPRQLLNIAKQHADWRAALQFARGLPWVDDQRLIAWGTSFAGGHVITLAGQGEPLAAIIAQVPHISGPASMRATGLIPVLRIASAGMRDQVGAMLGRAPYYIPTTGAPGARAMMTTPDAAAGQARLIAESIGDSGRNENEYPHTVAARIGLHVGRYSPGRFARRITCPALIQVADHDAITPREVALKAAHKIAHSTVRTYDCGHFDPYVEPLFSTVVADQLNFLHAAVPAT